MNGILKDRWETFTDEEKHVWEEWQAWDLKRYEHQCDIYENRHSRAKKAKKNKKESPSSLSSIPKKRKT